MPDLGLLAHALHDYERVLAAHHRTVEQAFDALTADYRALRDVYEGTGAREFAAGWQGVTASFDAYTAGVPPLLALLADKAELVRQADRGF